MLKKKIKNKGRGRGKINKGGHPVSLTPRGSCHPEERSQKGAWRAVLHPRQAPPPEALTARRRGRWLACGTLLWDDEHCESSTFPSRL